MLTAAAARAAAAAAVTTKCGAIHHIAGSPDSGDARPAGVIHIDHSLTVTLAAQATGPLMTSLPGLA